MEIGKTINCVETRCPERTPGTNGVNRANARSKCLTYRRLSPLFKFNLSMKVPNWYISPDMHILTSMFIYVDIPTYYPLVRQSAFYPLIRPFAACSSASAFYPNQIRFSMRKFRTQSLYINLLLASLHYIYMNLWLMLSYWTL